MRPIVIATLSLCACAIVLGLTFGQKAAKLSETDVIEYFATQYVDETGGQRSDCHATPSIAPSVWIIVSCGQGANLRKYFVDFQGKRISPPPAVPIV